MIFWSLKVQHCTIFIKFMFKCVLPRNYRTWGKNIQYYFFYINHSWVWRQQTTTTTCLTFIKQFKVKRRTCLLVWNKSQKNLTKRFGFVSEEISRVLATQIVSHCGQGQSYWSRGSVVEGHASDLSHTFNSKFNFY